MAAVVKYKIMIIDNSHGFSRVAIGGYYDDFRELVKSKSMINKWLNSHEATQLKIRLEVTQIETNKKLDWKIVYRHPLLAQSYFGEL